MSPHDPEKFQTDDAADIVAKVEKNVLPAAGIPMTNTATAFTIDESSTTSLDGTLDDKPDPFAHLPPHEAAILRTQVQIPNVKVNYITLYRYATKLDALIIVVSSFLAIVAGTLMPLMTVVFGALAGTFEGYFQGTISGDQFDSELAHFTLYFVYLLVGMLIVTFCATSGYMFTGERIAARTRQAFLAAVLRQNIAFFDELGAGEITTRITSDTNLIQDGISEKVPLTLQALSTFFAAFVVAFVRYWKLTLILCSSVVAIVTFMGVIGSFIQKWEKASLEKYGKGGSLAEEVLSSIRNATAFNAQEKLAKQYDAYLEAAEKTGFKVKASLGVLIGVLYFCIYSNYGLAVWMGSRFIVDGEMDLSQVLTIQIVIILGAISLGSVAPSAKAMTTAVAAASKIYATIDRVSPLDPVSDSGSKLDHVRGEIELRNIRHIYPSRPEVVVMESVSLHIPAGKSTALVGASGSGKSTIVGLVERFYNPVQGEVLLDGHDISTLNVRWLRQQMSLVSQEPVLFATSIAKNIAHGLVGTTYEGISEADVQSMVEQAAKTANAHDFISKLPKGYDTLVGDRGFLLSGGQKQRVAIARAIVSDPKILLLDEATSALDTKSEGVVQAALDKAAQGRTTIVIAHRLSTIKNADNIVVMNKGKIVEQGTHSQLLASNGTYYDLVEAQKIATAARENQMEPEETDDPDEVQIEKEEMPALSRASTGRPSSLKLTQSKASSMSVSGKVLKERKLNENSDVPDYPVLTLIKLVANFNRKEWHYMALGLLGCIVCGGAEPTAAVFFAKAITALSLGSAEYAELRSQANFWAGMYFMLAWIVGIAFVTHGIALGLCSEKLVHRARDAAFRSMLRQDMSFFDQEKNSAGALASFLSTETTRLAGISGATLGTILIGLTTMVSACLLGLAIGWKLALVCIAIVPILLFCGWLRYSVLRRLAQRSKAAYEKSASYACEAASAVRTVASLTREGDVCEQYTKSIEATRLAGVSPILRSSLLFGMSQSFTFGTTALGFWYGGHLIGDGSYTTFQFFVVFTSITFGAQSAGTMFAFASDMGKAKTAAAAMMELLDREPEIDSWSTEGTQLSTIEGHLEFRDVHFRYPTRPEVPVLRGLDLVVKPGQYIALVGPSGCGKSTTIALLERFYDPLSGEVLIDSMPISSVNLTSYRSRIALVSQEPTLYQGTIRDNILLGAVDESAVTEERITAACKQANIYDFILSLPQGFDTVVGSKGSLLSGGQKQRVAIARALLNDPKILLLDEATSALDSESEKVVQEALDRAARGRTTVAVAHRLSTIQRADVIYVFDQGRIVERGSHAELMRLKGRYCELVNLQNLA